MRKIIAFVLALTAIVVLFAACGDNKPDDGTTVDPLYTAYIPSSTQPGESTTTAPQSGGAIGATYVLTTNQGKTAPWYSTTRFVPTPVTSGTGNTITTNNYNNITYTTNSAMLNPSVTANVSYAPSTTWKPLTTTTRPNTTKLTAATTTTQKPTTTKPQPQGVDVVINDIYVSDGRLCASIDSEGWDSKIKAASKRIEIYVNGIPVEDPALLQISASNTTGDGFQYIYIDLSDFAVLDYGGTVSFTVPEGFLDNSTGTKYNYSFDVEASV